MGRAENPRTAAGAFLGTDLVRGAVGAEEEFGRARGRRLAQGLAVVFALGHGQAIGMRAQAAGENRVAVDLQVMRGDGRRDGARRGHDEIGRVLRGDMFEHDPERRKVLQHGHQHPLDEHGLAVEDVDLGIGHFAVDQQGHADLLHAVQHRIDRPD